ncbi:MAG TPA: 2-C-methyl-D-erythritol 4-phosphate cytidylyltransferase [Candidatus Angelobacter sp.]|nr:2-C-methyl-D-erythritol 4-phosphate cytidylyltransferase [Candidatus Angelobacter sp.]
MSRTVAAILVAAGRSSRMGSDKLWADLWGRPTWRWSLDTLLAVPDVERVAVTVPADSVDRFRAELPGGAEDRVVVVAGGEGRADSVIAGIWALTGAGHDDETLILVHDAARPAVTTELVQAVIDAARDGELAVVPIVPVADSLKRVRAERVVGPVERTEVAAAQTPQAAPLGVLRAAIEEAHAWGRPITDDAGALAAAGTPVRVVAGDPSNRKLTEPADLVAMRALLAERASPLSARPTADEDAGARWGIGFDAHRLAAGRPMILAGLSFPDEPRGPEGHSDGDAPLHALIDALLGAARLGDIGSLFPPNEDAWAGADSADLVRHAVARLADAGWRPTSADLSVAIERPALAPRRAEMAERVAELLGVGADAVSVKGTTSDGLGVTGGGGVAAWAIAGIEPRMP